MAKRKKREKPEIDLSKGRRVRSRIGHIENERGKVSEERMERIVQSLKDRALISDYTRTKKNSKLDHKGWDFLFSLQEFPDVFFPLQIKSSFTGKEEFEARGSNRIHVIVVRPDISDNKLERWLGDFLYKCRVGEVEPVSMGKIEEISAKKSGKKKEKPKKNRKNKKEKQDSKKEQTTPRLHERIEAALSALVANEDSLCTDFRRIDADCNQYLLELSEGEPQYVEFVGVDKSAAMDSDQPFLIAKDTYVVFLGGNSSAEVIAKKLGNDPRIDIQQVIYSRFEETFAWLFRRESFPKKINNWKELSPGSYELELTDGRKVVLSVKFTARVGRYLQFSRMDPEGSRLSAEVSCKAINGIHKGVVQVIYNLNRRK